MIPPQAKRMLYVKELSVTLTIPHYGATYVYTYIGLDILNIGKEGLNIIFASFSPVTAAGDV